MLRQSIVESFNSAIEGFIYVFKSQRNMRLHFLIAFFVLFLGLFLNFTPIELIVLSITIALVLVSEMVNTAIEHTIDLVKEEFHPLARIVKDIAAGAVLVSAFSSIVVGYVLFISRAGVRIEESLTKIRETDWHITFIILLTVMSAVIICKIFLHRGTPFRGGMPSGHSAIAFSIWAIISLFYPKSLVVFLVFILALLVARSRIRDNVHTVSEVFFGGLLGVLVSVAVFQFLRI